MEGTINYELDKLIHKCSDVLTSRIDSVTNYYDNIISVKI